MSNTTKTEKIFEGLEYMCLIGPMESSLTPNLNCQAFICVDGGAHLKESLPPELPCLTIGDGDSYDKAHDITYPKKKDLNDFALALKLLPKTITQIDLYGLRNGRKDHEIINIGEMLNYLDSHINLQMASFINTESDTWLALNTGTHILNFVGTFTVITLQKQKITIAGEALYKGEDITLNVLTSQGLSNQASGSFTIECQKPVLVMRSQGE